MPDEKGRGEKLRLQRENVTELYQSPFLKLYDLSYEPGQHYYSATRRGRDELAALKSEEAFRSMLPDAVSCVVIIKLKGKESFLCLDQEFRYPTGQFLLSIPAGLLDEEDRGRENPVFSAAVRELREETGLCLEEGDEIRLVNPLLFSSPGMTDESNAVVQIVLNREELPTVTQEGAVGGERFDGYQLVDRRRALELLKMGTDEKGIFYSVYTWIALMCFVSGLWDEEKGAVER